MTRVLLTTVFRPFGVENKYKKKATRPSSPIWLRA